MTDDRLRALVATWREQAREAFANAGECPDQLERVGLAGQGIVFVHCADHLESLLASGGSPEPGWRAISTARMDGKWVLAYWARFRTYAVVRLIANGEWVDEDDAVYAEPSHWMPLPPAPVVTPAHPEQE